MTMFMSSINQNHVTTSFIGSYFGTFLECTHPLNVTLFVICFFFFSPFSHAMGVGIDHRQLKPREWAKNLKIEKQESAKNLGLKCENGRKT